MLRIGGCETIMMIDSGSPVNAIPEEVWEGFKDRLICKELRNSCSENIFAYATGEPLDVKAVFTADATVVGFNKPKLENVRWHVIKGAGQGLLSKTTSELLKVLKVGVEVQALKVDLGKTSKIPESSSKVTKRSTQLNAARPNEPRKKSNSAEKMRKVVVRKVVVPKTIKKIDEFPKIPNFQLKFKVDKSVRPVRIPRVRIPAPLSEAVQQRLDEMEKLGIIEDSPYDTEWISPLEVVVKGKDDFRIVLDMRRPNEAIQRAHHPLPEVQLVLEKLKGAKFFTKLDLTSAFFHIELHKESRNITSFMTPKGLKRFTRLVFGVNTAPEVFQREMENIFRDCPGTIIFIDDILVFANSIEELHHRVETVKKRIKVNNLTLNDKKCRYDQSKIDFLGMTLSGEGFKPSPDKIEAIRNCQTPTNTENLRSFMGLVTHLSNYIRDLATIAEPLRNLIRKNTKWIWGSSESKAFDEVRRRICDDITDQAFYDVNLPTKLYTDASGVGLGAVMVQVQPDCTDRVVAYASKSLTETEKRYPQFQRESLAVVWAIERFSHFLLGKHFSLYTDNKGSEYLFGNKERSSTRAISRAEGWALRLSMYSFDVMAVKGTDNIADALSRLCQPGDNAYEEPDNNQEFNDVRFQIKSLELKTTFQEDWEVSEGIDDEDSLMILQEEPQQKFSLDEKKRWKKLRDCEIKCLRLEVGALYNSQKSIPWETIVNESKKDEAIALVKNALITENWENAPPAYEKIRDELFMRGDVLIRGLQIVLPASLRSHALDIVHLNHAGEASMKKTLRDRVWWPGLNRDTEKKRSDCKSCTQVSRKDPPPPMQRTQLPDKPWEYLAMDFFSAGECSGKILSITDYYSRYLVCLTLPSENAEKTIEALDELFHRLGRPRVIKADNGPPFQSIEFKAYCCERDIKIVHSTPYYPQQNGMAERSMQTIKKGIKIAFIENRSWRAALRDVEAAYNSTVHSETLKTPNEMLYQRKFRGGLPIIERQEEFDDGELRKRDEAAKEKGKMRENKARRARDSNIDVGDTVLVENLRPSSKLTPRFGADIHTVIGKEGPRLKLKSASGSILDRHVTQVKKWDHEEETPNESATDAGKPIDLAPSQPARKKMKIDEPVKRYETRSAQQKKGEISAKN